MSEEVNELNSELTDVSFNGFINKYQEFVKFLKDCVTQIGELKEENSHLKKEIAAYKIHIDNITQENCQLRQEAQALVCRLNDRQSTVTETNQLRNENRSLKEDLKSLQEEHDVLQTEVSLLREQKDMIRTELMEVRNENDLLNNEIIKNKKAMDIARNFLQSSSVNGVVNSLPEFSEQMVLTEDKSNSMTAFGSLAHLQDLRQGLCQSKEDTYHSTRMESGQTSVETYYSAIGSHRSSLANGSTGARPKMPNGVLPTLNHTAVSPCIESQLNETLITGTTESSDYKIDENNNLRLKHVKVCVGKLIPVKMAYYVSPTNFYLHINPYKVNNYIHIIQVKQQVDMCQRPNCNLTAADITIGMYCAAMYSEDDLWYRAQVVKINYENSVEKDSIKSVLVHYIDWGNFEERPLSKLMKLSLDLTERKQAIHCYIQGYQEYDYSEQEIKDFEDKIKDKKLSATFYRYHKRDEQLESVIYPIDLIVEIEPDVHENAVNLLPIHNILDSTLSEVSEQRNRSSPIHHRESAHTSETIVCNTQVNGHSTRDLARDQSNFQMKDLEMKSKSNQNCSTNSNKDSHRVPEIGDQVPKSMPHLNVTNIENNDNSYRISCPNVDDLNSGDGLIVQVAHISSPQHFYLYINDVRFGTGQLEDLDDKLNQFYSKDRPFACVQPSDVTPGSFWVCPYSDNRWYRCRVLNVEGNNVLVNYVDYGNEEIVDIKDLKFLTRQFSIYPAMAVKCRLSNVSAIDSNIWSNESIEYFRHLVGDEKPLTAFIAQKPESYDFESFLDVFLWTSDQNNKDILVNLLLVVNNYASTDNQEWVDEAERSLREKTPPEELMSEIIPKINSITSQINDSVNEKKIENSNKLVNGTQSNHSNGSIKKDKKVQLNDAGDEWNRFGMDEDAFCDENNYNFKPNDPGVATLGFGVSNRQICKYIGTPQGCRLKEMCKFSHIEPQRRYEINETEEEINEVEDMELEVGSYVILKVTQVQSPFSFYGVLPHGPRDVNKYEFVEELPQFEPIQKMSSDLKKRYSNEVQTNLNTYPGISTLVAYRDEDGAFYRGRVIDSDLEAKTCTIFNIDLGLETTVARNVVYRLHSAYTRLPCQAIHCSLFGILPINGTVWSPESIDAFYNLVNQRVVCAYIMYGKTEGKYFIELYDKEDEQEIIISDKLVAMNYARRNITIDTVYLPPENDSDEIYNSDSEVD